MNHRMRVASRVLCLICAISLIPTVAFAAKTVYVNCARPDDAGDGLTWEAAKKTVQAGIDAAESGDQVWVAKGLYVERITLELGAELYGGFACNETQLSQRNWVTNVTILDGNRGGSVITSPVGATASTRVDGFAIRNGKASPSGGGIYCWSSSPTITNNAITGNSASYGGGIYCESSSPTITNNAITANRADNKGGGIYCYSSSPTIANNTITGNSAYDGGGICCYSSSPTIANNTITGDSARYGGGISCGWDSSPTISNNIIAGNTAGSDAGGIFLDFRSSPAIWNNTITGNAAPRGGGIFSWFSSAVISNNIVASNQSGVVQQFGAVSLRSNCVFGNGAYNYSGVSPGVGDISADPLLENSPGGDYHLRRGSPCIESGDNSYVSSTTDLDGAPRIQGARVDMGAYEYPIGGGTGVLYARLEAPAAVRPGREYTARVHYGNAGNADLPVPLLHLSNSSGVRMRIGQEGRESTEGLALLGVPPAGYVMLPPGFEGSIPIAFAAPPSGTVEFTLKALDDRSTSVDWPALEPVLRPDGVAPDDPEWQAFWSQATGTLGTTWGQVLDVVAQMLGGTSAPPEQLADFTGDLRYALALAGEPEAQTQVQRRGVGYSPSGDVTVTRVPAGASFDCSKPTYVVTHGWNPSNNPSPGLWTLGQAIKGRCSEQNVLVVEWPKGAFSPRLYPWGAAGNIAAAGDEAFSKIKQLYNSECHADPPDSFWDQVTYVGHSFGNGVNAQIASHKDGRGKAVILDPSDPLGGYDSSFSGVFKDGSVSINSDAFGDATPCGSPRLAGTALELTGASSHTLSHRGALDCLTNQLLPTGGCDNPILRGNWNVSTANPRCYDGTMTCEGTVHMATDCSDCEPSVTTPGEVVSSANSRVVQPVDPNEKTGPAGEGPDKLVSPLDGLEYTIYFENAPQATAPVQEAIITDDLSSHLDWTTFQLQEIAFGDKIVPIDGGASYTGSVDIPNLRVDLTASINAQTGRAQWILRAIDPTTGQPPVDPLVGFLPPNDCTTPNDPNCKHTGEGHVRFKIRPKADTPVGTVISNTASIVFDQMTPTPTPPISNTIGAFPPGEVGNPTPADGATDVGINTALAWSAANRTTSYDLYVWPNGQPKPATPTAAGWPATGYQPMADFALATTYRWQVVAKNPVGETPGPEWAFTTAPLSPVTYARSLGNGKLAGISRAVVSAAFPDFFYVEADDRSSGIRVERPAHGLSVGMRAEVTGTVKTSADGERYIEATWATKNGTGWVNPLGMNREFLGGVDFLFNGPTGAGQQGVLDGLGLNNIGLLVKLWGRVTEIEQASPPTWFILDDGTGPGVKCVIPSDVTISPAWQLISVTGISSCEKVGNELHRLLRVRTQADIVPVL